MSLSKGTTVSLAYGKGLSPHPGVSSPVALVTTSAASAGPTPGAITLVDSSVQTGNISSYTFTGLTIGAAAADRIIAVVVQSEGSNALDGINSITVDSVTAAVQANGLVNNGNTRTHAIIAAVTAPTGTSADVVVNWPQNKHGCAVALFKIDNIASVQAYDTTTISTQHPVDATISAPSNGVMLGAGTQTDGGANASWTGLTEAYDNSTSLPEVTLRWTAGATAVGTGADENAVITFATPATVNQIAGAFASWGA